MWQSPNKGKAGVNVMGPYIVLLPVYRWWLLLFVYHRSPSCNTYGGSHPNRDSPSCYSNVLRPQSWHPPKHQAQQVLTRYQSESREKLPPAQAARAHGPLIVTATVATGITSKWWKMWGPKIRQNYTFPCVNKITRNTFIRLWGEKW